MALVQYCAFCLVGGTLLLMISFGVNLVQSLFGEHLGDDVGVEKLRIENCLQDRMWYAGVVGNSYDDALHTAKAPAIACSLLPLHTKTRKRCLRELRSRMNHRKLIRTAKPFN
eukprot:6068458-Amphidinium_carterae.1